MPLTIIDNLDRFSHRFRDKLMASNVSRERCTFFLSPSFNLEFENVTYSLNR